jgi:Domain of unknown function (DUF5134)
MNAPAWLPVILALLMIAIAGYSLWRMAMSRFLDMRSDLGHDAVVFLLAAATAGMLVRWMHVFRPGVWALLLAAAGVWFVARAVALGRGPGEGRAGGSTRPALAAAAGCAIGVYMLLAGVAPSTINGSTAGYYTMAGMSDMYKDTTITFPALGVILAVLLLGYAVATLDRISPSQDRAEIASVEASVAGVLAPRTLALCEVVIVLTMAYAIFAKLV